MRRKREKHMPEPKFDLGSDVIALQKNQVYMGEVDAIIQRSNEVYYELDLDWDVMEKLFGVDAYPADDEFSQRYTFAANKAADKVAYWKRATYSARMQPKDKRENRGIEARKAIFEDISIRDQPEKGGNDE